MLAARLGRRRRARSRPPADAVLARVGPLALLDALGDAQQREVVLDFVREHDRRPVGRDVYEGWLERETHPRLLSTDSSTDAAWRPARDARVQAFLDQVFLQPAR